MTFGFPPSAAVDGAAVDGAAGSGVVAGSFAGSFGLLSDNAIAYRKGWPFSLAAADRGDRATC